MIHGKGPKLQKTKGALVHPVTQHALRQLGEDISLARRARRISMEDFAERAGISRATLHRLERGDAGVSLNTLAMALHVLGRLDLLQNLLGTSSDDIGLMMMRKEVPKRIARNTPSKAQENDSSPPSPDYMEW